jgi:fibronectin-binding autotransporter adhesin
MTIQSSTGTNILSGVISDSANLTLINSSPMILSGANTYTGITTLGGGTVQFGAANVISNSIGLTLDGGTLDPGGFNQTIAALTLSDNSTIDFEAGASELDFAASASSPWSGTLSLANWNPSTDKLRFGTNATGLTAIQLQSFEFNGTNANAELDANGYLVIAPPAPVTILPPAVSGTNIDFSFATTSGLGYTVWATTNLVSANWIMATNFIGDGGTDQVTLPIAGPTQFFRVSQP